MKKIGILGSTGSVGSQTLEIIDEYKDEFELVFISGHSNIEKLNNQIDKYNPKYACLSNDNILDQINDQFSFDKLYKGNQGLIDLCDIEVDLVVNAISGYKGLYLSVKLLENNINIALSNKESIVQAGSILTKMAKDKNLNIFPVDSEHSALWQCIMGENQDSIDKLILTGSGGPFRELDKEKFYNVTKEQALKHPNWSMGNKITIDSATMMNKGFEVIEAHHLFDIPYNDINIVIHPESIIHSMVKFIDGSIKAQLSIPTMRIPIQFALSYPQRLKNESIDIDFTLNNKFSFEKVDDNKFRCIKLAYDAGKKSGTYPTVLNVANDMAVDMFLNDMINFSDIPEIIEESLNSHSSISNPSIDDIKETTLKTENFINNYKSKRV
tara:strand:- start:613 stop:1761 length:1149 start_codon:yes stop_codon:yes gene_type:complete